MNAASSFQADRFQGKVSIVTGAGSGLGRATAQRLAAEGSSVACFDINEGAAKETADSVGGGHAVALACDVSDEASVVAAVAGAVDAFGPPDVVCNVAGIGRFQHSTEVERSDWDRIIGVNLTGTFLVCKATLPFMLDRDGMSRVIVNVASSAALLPQPYSAAYCASKGGVVMLTKALAFEYRRRNVRVNAVAPGGIDTPMIATWGYPEGAPFNDFDHMVSALGFCQPEEVAGTIAYVASDDARYMTGSVVVIDGGISM